MQAIEKSRHSLHLDRKSALCHLLRPIGRYILHLLLCQENTWPLPVAVLTIKPLELILLVFCIIHLLEVLIKNQPAQRHYSLRPFELLVINDRLSRSKLLEMPTEKVRSPRLSSSEFEVFLELL